MIFFGKFRAAWIRAPLGRGGLSLVLALAVSCMASEPAGPGQPIEKGETTMFSTHDVPYPLLFGNLQRNSFVRRRPAERLRILWSRDFSSDIETPGLAATAVLIGGDRIGVRTGERLLLYMTDGSFLDAVPIAGNQPVFFGSGAFAYIDPNHQLHYRGYDGKPLLDAQFVPALDDYAALLLLRPGPGGFLGAVLFTGGPQRAPRRHDIYSMPHHENFWSWGVEGEGGLDVALMTADESLLLWNLGNEFILTDSATGSERGRFGVSASEIESASIDLSDRLSLVAAASFAGRQGDVFLSYDLNGTLRWRFPLHEPKLHQPPAAGSDGRVHLFDTRRILCLREGKLLWKFTLPGLGKAWMTVAGDDTLVVVQDGRVFLIDGEGRETASVDLGGGEEFFDAPPALDREGRVVVAGSRHLYLLGE